MSEAAILDIIFNEARTHSYWQEKDIPDEILSQVYNLAKMAPTSMNCSPARITFVKSAEAKEKLKECLMGGNIDKTMSAPVCAIIANDMEFYEQLPKLFPHAEGAKNMFVGKDDYIADTAYRNGTLQGAYFIIAARALGLDCGPMSGFDNAKCDELFFSGTNFKSNFLCNLGYGDPKKLHPRSPRLEFADACKIV